MTRHTQDTAETCTCGEPPDTGHFLWCEALRGRPEFRPRTAPTKVKPETLTDEERAEAIRKLHCLRCLNVITGQPKASPCYCGCHNARRGQP